MKITSLFSKKILLFTLFWVAWVLPSKVFSQFPTSCVFPTNQQTLCQQLGALTPQIQILTATQSASWLSNWNNKVVFIDAEFTVNTAFSITNCTLKFGTSGRIVVTTGGTLTANNSRYFGCSGWDGIKVEGSGALQFNDNIIEDALYGITIKSSTATSTITGNTFNRNIVDLYVPSAVTANALITGNTFDCTSNTFQGARSDVGILTQKSILPFGLPLGNYNFVRNHRQGANLYSSNVTMRNVDFDCNIETGIFAKGGRLDLNTDPGFSFVNNFFHNRADIMADGVNLFVQLTNFSECQSDNITSVGNINAQDVVIKFNNYFINDDNQFAINHHKSGIMLDRSSGTSGSGAKNQLSFNGFTFDNWTVDEARSAILVTGYPGTEDRMKINGNQVRVFNGGSNPSVARSSTFFDVAINEAFNFDVTENHILTQNFDSQNNRSRWGFYLHNRISPSSGHTLLGNTVLSMNGVNDYGMCAFHFQDCGPWSICYNQTDKTLRGFHVRGACGTSEFGANILGEHLKSTATNTGPTAALILEQTAVLGPQYCRKNHFTLGNYAPDNGAEHRGNVGVILGSRFDVDPTVALETPNPTFPAMGWFFQTPACLSVPANHCGGEELPHDRDYLNEKEMAVIMANQTYIEPANVSEWDDRRQVIAKLLRYPDLKTQNIVANTFFSAQENSSAALYASWDETMNQAMQISSLNQAALTDIRFKMTALVSTLDGLDRTLTTQNEVRSANRDFFENRHTILSGLGEALSQEEVVIKDIETTRTTALGDCEYMLRTLPQNTPYEVNQVFLNGILLKYAYRQSLNSTDIANLQAIALQCPDIAGSTRNTAANWLTPGDLAKQIWETGEMPLCNPEIRNAQDFSPTTEACRLWPNPVESTINIGFKVNFTGEIKVFALNGQTPLMQKNVEDVSNAQLSTENLTSGVYVLTALSNDGQKFSRKFVVIK